MLITPPVRYVLKIFSKSIGLMNYQNTLEFRESLKKRFKQNVEQRTCLNQYKKVS